MKTLLLLLPLLSGCFLTTTDEGDTKKIKKIVLSRIDMGIQCWDTDHKMGPHCSATVNGNCNSCCLPCPGNPSP